MNTRTHFTAFLAGLIVLGIAHSCAEHTAGRQSVKTKLTAERSHMKPEEPGAPVITQQFFGCKAHR